VPSCGDGVIDVGEACDDGNSAVNDGCSSLCTVEAGWKCFAGVTVGSTIGSACVFSQNAEVQQVAVVDVRLDMPFSSVQADLAGFAATMVKSIALLSGKDASLISVTDLRSGSVIGTVHILQGTDAVDANSVAANVVSQLTSAPLTLAGFGAVPVLDVQAQASHNSLIVTCGDGKVVEVATGTNTATVCAYKPPNKPSGGGSSLSKGGAAAIGVVFSLLAVGVAVFAYFVKRRRDTHNNSVKKVVVTDNGAKGHSVVRRAASQSQAGFAASDDIMYIHSPLGPTERAAIAAKLANQTKNPMHYSASQSQIKQEVQEPSAPPA